ncbi:LysM peptidoglycan-binding domain-containing protein [Planococcus shenhongbingii]|uniref:LysM peptidoglycan-binding domain-containing protein n=1 Tax=Planococcus shenhongbingii TaxID=3058398 RepID=A0ABT8N859_9BACL|nr:LysM peptidoglycan-binding domain-containing protein [Planococcus sp. N017]MDN7244074.1 LysM peptidoglycan-binding domain-containing protein [Planococcus sp. N017]
MGKQNYRKAIEKGRQEIPVQSIAAPSRRAQRKAVNKKPKKTKNMLLPTLFFIFMLIPVTLLIYVYFLHEPNDTLITSTVNDQVSLETTPPASETPLVPVEGEEKEEEPKALAEKEAKEAKAQKAAAEKEQAKKEAAVKEKEQAEAEAKAKAEAQAKAEAEAEAKAQTEAKAKAEAEAKAQAEAKAKAEAEAKAQAEVKAKAEAEAKRQQEQQAAQKEKEAKEKAKSSQKTHVVQSGETLYRIAVNAYGAAGANAGVEKIKQANGLTSNEISVGSTLILP